MKNEKKIESKVIKHLKVLLLVFQTPTACLSIKTVFLGNNPLSYLLILLCIICIYKNELGIFFHYTGSLSDSAVTKLKEVIQLLFPSVDKSLTAANFLTFIICLFLSQHLLTSTRVCILDFYNRIQQ